MKFLILTLCLAYAVADVSHILPKAGGEKDARIVKQELDVGSQGTYQFAYETENGISGSESGSLKEIPQAENPAEQVQGQVQYTAPGGEVIRLQYIADENGFQPQGDHLPTSPPIPEAILRSLEFIRAHPPAPEQ